MVEISKHQTVLKRSGYETGAGPGTTYVGYVQIVDEGEQFHQVFIKRSTYDEMGSPDVVTMTIESGDMLNPQESILPTFTEEQAKSLGDISDVPVFDPSQVEGLHESKLEEVETGAHDIDDGFDMEQCSIRHSHGTHTWSRANAPEKPLMCEGV